MAGLGCCKMGNRDDNDYDDVDDDTDDAGDASGANVTFLIIHVVGC